MCGIFGVFSSKKVNKTVFKESLFLQKHRGPDCQNSLFLDENTALGHVRLSIIDLDERSSQPFEYKCLILVFNGEIFNYIELRNELIENGYNFITSGDTEVVIKAFDFWGDKCVKRFNGMWAFYIYNKDTKEIFISRDRFGIKPMYYAYTKSEFYISSEIKSILNYNSSFRKPNSKIIHSYIRESLGAQLEETWFKDIKRVKPAYNIYFSLKSDQIIEKRYWNYPKDRLNLSFEEAKKKYIKILDESVKLRMRSDVPVGLTLSSGLDSTAIAFVANKLSNKALESFTASFPNETYDEFPEVEKFVSKKNINSNQVLTDYANYVKSLDKLIYHLESGHSSPAIIPLQCIMNEAKEKVTVLLEGQGADELLGGYNNTFMISYLKNLLIKFKIRKLLKEIHLLGIKRIISYSIIHLRTQGGHRLRYLMRKIYGFEKVLQKSDIVYQKRVNYYDKLNNILRSQHTGGLVNLLHYGDTISMMYSLESRLPFLDYKLVEFIFRLPFEYKYKLGKGKLIHREAFRSKLPSNIIDETNKIGFVSPIKEIMSSKEVSDILNSKRFLTRGIVKEIYFKELYSKHKSGGKDYGRFLFRLFSVELWYRNFID